MRLPRPRLTAAVLAVCVTAAITLGFASPAEAHKHPTPVQLISPAVVRIMTYGRVSISLIEHNSLGLTGKDIQLVQRSYTPLLATGSGFVVNPTGVIVTSPAVTAVNLQRAQNYAVNRIFAERYGDGAPMPADPFSRSTRPVNSGDVVGQRLKRCYAPNTTDETGGCVVFVQSVITVQPFVSDQKAFGNLQAQVIYPTGGKTANVTVLKVGASSMPSVTLGTSNSAVEATSTLGFTATPSNEASLRAINAHFTAKGASTVKVDEFVPQIDRGLANGMTGGPVVSEKGQVIGFLTGSGSKLSLVGPDQVADALAAVNVTPGRGPTDILYENALHNYNNQLYTAAAPNLTQVLKLYPGHALATAKLAVANQRKGSALDKGSQGATDTSGFGPTNSQGSSDSNNSPNILLWGGIAAVVVLLLLLGLVLLRGRKGRKEPEAPPAGPDPNLVPAGYVHPALGAPYPGPAGMPTSAPPSAWPTSAPPAGWAGWNDPRQAAPYSSPPYHPGPFAPQSGVPYQGGPHQGGDPNAEQQTVMRLSPTNPPPMPGGSGAETTVNTGGAGTEGAPAGVMARQDSLTPCDQCGQPLAPGQQFCGYCGNRAH
jgi:hypothetical protein